MKCLFVYTFGWHVFMSTMKMYFQHRNTHTFTFFQQLESKCFNRIAVKLINYWKFSLTFFIFIPRHSAWLSAMDRYAMQWLLCYCCCCWLGFFLRCDLCCHILYPIHATKYQHSTHQFWKIPFVWAMMEKGEAKGDDSGSGAPAHTKGNTKNE